MIEFVTLFLGLVFGPQTVEVSVAEQVVAVEIRLNGSTLAQIEGSPWSAACDFGSLAPGRLEAVAFDENGAELGRVLQWINMPTRRATARLSVEAQEGGGARGRLVWEALDHDRPSEVRLSFDGAPLQAADYASFELPEHDPASLHFLRAELRFPGGVETSAELVFGGTFGDAMHTELTAVPVLLEGRRLPRPEQMAGWLQARGEALRVVAVDRERADLVVVRDPSPETLKDLREMSRWRNKRVGLASALHAPLTMETRLRFVFPVSIERARPGRELHISPVSADLSNLLDSSLFRILTETTFDELEPAEDRALADALAVAGLVAAGGNRRRAVLLLHSVLGEDRSVTDLEAARGYLAALRVPMVSWTTFPGATGVDSTKIWKPSGFTRASGDLLEMLNRQAILWVEGAFLPAEVELTPKAKGLRFPP